MNELIKKIALRLLLLIVIIVLGNFLYLHTTYEKDVTGNGNVIQKFEKGAERADVLYFSASPNAAYFRTDQDQRFISQMVDDGLRNLHVESVDTGAIHAGVFRKLIEMIPTDAPVKYVIVHMNYRSFGMGWIESKLENSIQKQMVFYNDRPAIINRFLQGLNWYDALSLEEREKRMLHAWATSPLPFSPPKASVESWCTVEKWGDWTNPKRQLADHYIKNFAFTLDEENPRVRDFDAISQICKEKGLQLIYVILPENLEEAEQLVDGDLTHLMIDNKNWLKDRYSKQGAIVLDFFDAVPDSCFIERDFPSEHYKETGRRTIADGIISAIREMEPTN